MNKGTKKEKDQRDKAESHHSPHLKSRSLSSISTSPTSGSPAQQKPKLQHMEKQLTEVSEQLIHDFVPTSELTDNSDNLPTSDSPVTDLTMKNMLQVLRHSLQLGFAHLLTPLKLAIHEAKIICNILRQKRGVCLITKSNLRAL